MHLLVGSTDMSKQSDGDSASMSFKSKIVLQEISKSLPAKYQFKFRKWRESTMIYYFICFFLSRKWKQHHFKHPKTTQIPFNQQFLLLWNWDRTGKASAARATSLWSDGGDAWSDRGGRPGLEEHFWVASKDKRRWIQGLNYLSVVWTVVLGVTLV